MINCCCKPSNYNLSFIQLKAARAESIVQGNDEQKKSQPHLMNINEDPMLSGVVFHFLQNGETTIGRKDAKPEPKICFSGIRFSLLNISLCSVFSIT